MNHPLQGLQGLKGTFPKSPLREEEIGVYGKQPFKPCKPCSHVRLPPRIGSQAPPPPLHLAFPAPFRQ